MNAVPFATDHDVEAALDQVMNHLEMGGLLAYPTETVYGLGSRPVEAEVARLAQLKSRQVGKPFLLLLSGLEMALRYGLQFGRSARALADRFWPGALTLVLPGGEGSLPELLRGPEGGIAVRWTSHTNIGRLIEHCDTPLTSTSANRPGTSPAPGAAAVLEAFGASVRDGTLLVLDAGVLGNRPPSTVVDCTGERPRLIREGAIPLDELRASVGSLAP
jgi:L-threonylcarbamoyladenylate synthase